MAGRESLPAFAAGTRVVPERNKAGPPSRISIRKLPICGLGARVSPDGYEALIWSDGDQLATWSLTRGGQPQPVNGSGTRADWSRFPSTAMITVMSSGNENWPPAVPLAGDSDSYVLTACVAAPPDPATAGVLQHVVAIGGSDVVIYRAQLPDGSWTPFSVVPGVDRAPACLHAVLTAATADKYGNLHVLALDPDEEKQFVYHAMRYPDGTWSGFMALDGYGGGANFAARTMAVTVVDGDAHVVANGLDIPIVFHRVRLGNGNWTPWAPVPGTEASNTFSLAMAAAANGNVFVLATQFGGGILRQMRRPSGDWDGWVPLSGVPADSDFVSLSITKDNVAWVAYVEHERSVTYTQRRPNPELRSAWTDPAWSSYVMSDVVLSNITALPWSGLVEIVATQFQDQ